MRVTCEFCGRPVIINPGSIENMRLRSYGIYPMHEECVPESGEPLREGLVDPRNYMKHGMIVKRIGTEDYFLHKDGNRLSVLVQGPMGSSAAITGADSIRLCEDGVYVLDDKKSLMLCPRADFIRVTDNGFIYIRSGMK